MYVQRIHTVSAFIFCLLGLTAPALAQTTINGNIVDDIGSPQEFANVLLLNPVDSSLIRGSISNTEGDFNIEQVPPGTYLLLTRSIGFASTYTGPFAISAGQKELALGTISLSTGIALDAVNIVARKPLYEQKIDRMVVNVESSITSAGGTALEILERSPGVVVDRQNSVISLVGKDGVVIMINGKINYMPTSAVVQLLAGMSADNIERIELITTPSAQFDAEGNAGFINIVLKESTEYGTNGSYTLMAGYGDDPEVSANVSFYNRTNRVSIAGSYGFLREEFDQLFSNRRKINYQGNTTESFTESYRDPIQRDHNARFTVDVQVSPRTTIGLLLAGYDNKWTMEAMNDNRVNTNGIRDSSLTLINTERNQWSHYMANFNVQHKIADKHTISCDVDLLNYRDENPNTYETTFFNSSGEQTRMESTRSDKVTPIDIAVGKVDYMGTLSDKLKLSAGMKAVRSTFTNRVSVEQRLAGGWIIDPDFTATSELGESIYATYASVEYALDEKTSAQAGLRYEYTDSNLDTDETQNVVDREFGSLFPSLFVSRKINDNHSLGLAYSRRITRPTFNQMAPFVIFLDPSTFFAGNTALQPAISNSIKADYRYKTAIFSLQYTHEDSTIARFQNRVDPASNKQVTFPTNLKNRKTWSLSVGLPIYISDWWTMQNNIIIMHERVTAYYDDAPVELTQAIVQANSVQSFKLPRNFTLEISGFYRSKGISGTLTRLPTGILNAGIEKDFGGRWGTLRLGVDDILNTLQWETATLLENQAFESYGTYDFSRPTVRLTYSRRFGNTKLKEGRRRSTGSEEERNRIN